MRALLRRSNQALLGEVDKLESALSSASVLPELSAYDKWIGEVCAHVREQGFQNLQDLDRGRDEILPDVLSETQRLAGWFRLYNERLVGPLLRSLPSDRLCLRVIAWLHSSHPEVQHVPAALSDGSFGVWPDPRLPIVYFMPSSRQLGLLYLPLLFHQFGHLLYTCHKPEMDDLVRELQERIEDLLTPISQRDDAQARERAKLRKAIVETWYEWAQELFCDAVGFTIGGPCFIHAFSTYFQMGGRSVFHLPPEDLEMSSHPVTWLRIRLLTDRVRKAGLFTESDDLKTEWDNIAKMVGVSEDYYGFYGAEFLPHVRQTLDDMLVETSPYHYIDSDLSSSKWDPDRSSPVHLVNRAWSVFLDDPEEYDRWERRVINAFLAATTSSREVD